MQFSFIETSIISTFVGFIVYFFTKKILIWHYKRKSKKAREYYQEKQRLDEENKGGIQNITKDRALQRLEDICDGDICKKSIMNEEENKIYYALIRILKDSYNINPQVSFKAFLKGEENTNAWRSFSDFYCDFLITSKDNRYKNTPIAIVEYHGGKHYGDTQEIQERVKKNDLTKQMICQKAKLKLFVITQKDIKKDSIYIDDKKLESYIIKIKSKL